MDIKNPKKRVLYGIKSYIFDLLASIYVTAVDKYHNAQSLRETTRIQGKMSDFHIQISLHPKCWNVPKKETER